MPTAPQPGHGYRLPPAAYFDTKWFERELEQLFPATWNFVCTTAQIDEPGRYYTTRIGHYPIAIVRGEDRSVRAFHNICRHRGARILDGASTCKRIVCPYHRWQYGLDGKLQNVPQVDEQLPDIDYEDWGLQPVAVDTWMGLVFVNPDGRADPLTEWLGELPKRLGAFDLEHLAELGCAEYQFDANWKFYVENHIDWYHLWYTHARTLAMLDSHKGYWHHSGAHWLSFAPFKTDSGYAEPFRPLPGLNAEQRMVNAHLLFPNLPLFGGASWFGIGLLTPMSPERTRMALRIWGLPGQDPTRFLEGFHEITQLEDASMAARLQATVRSPAFQVGP